MPMPMGYPNMRPDQMGMPPPQFGMAAPPQGGPMGPAPGMPNPLSQIQSQVLKAILMNIAQDPQKSAVAGQLSVIDKISKADNTTKRLGADGVPGNALRSQPGAQGAVGSQVAPLAGPSLGGGVM